MVVKSNAESRQVSFKMEGNGMNMRKRAERREGEDNQLGRLGHRSWAQGERVLRAAGGRPAAR